MADYIDEHEAEAMEWLDFKLSTTADKWPSGSDRPRSTTSVELVDPNGAWGADACGVTVKLCTDNLLKGKGVFAARAVSAGAVVGCFAGEPLSQRQYALRYLLRGEFIVFGSHSSAKQSAEMTAPERAVSDSPFRLSHCLVKRCP